MRRGVARGLGVIGMLIAVGVILLAVFFRPLIRRVMHPAGPFAMSPLPAPPDYGLPTAWSVLPGQESAAFARLPAIFPAPSAPPVADVFYVHPTSYVGPKWNGSVDDAELNAATDRVATRIQASAFLDCCVVYAPRYRQANGMAFASPSPDGDRAIDVAYGDVERAFLAFQDRRRIAGETQPRPFLIAAHSQGTMLAYRLLKAQISGRPAGRAFVAAYLLGGLVTRDAVARDLPDIPVCAAPDQTGCLVGLNARGPAFVPNNFDMDISGSQGIDRATLRAGRVCVNPLSWRDDALPAPAEQHPGAVFFDEASPHIVPGFTAAECRQGALIVAPRFPVPRDFMSRILDNTLGPQNYHPVEYQLFFVPLRQNARARVAAFVARQASGTASPTGTPPTPVPPADRVP